MKTEKLLFGKTNYLIMGAGLLLIAIGYLLMMGGGSEDPEVFNPEIFNSTRTTVAPALLVIGFVVEIFAIMYRPKTSSTEASAE